MKITNSDFLTYEQEVMERVKKMHEALIRGEIPEEPEETEAEQNDFWRNADDRRGRL